MGFMRSYTNTKIEAFIYYDVYIIGYREVIKMKQKQIIEILNPIFPGFYESVLDGGHISSMVQDNDDYELGGYLNDNDFEIEYDYKEYKKDVMIEINDLFIEKVNESAKRYCNVENLLMKNESSEMVSPKYYNYETDRIYIKISVDGTKYAKFINTMFKKHRDTLEKFIKKNHTSYSGFHSFYSNAIDEWYKKRLELDYNELGTVFEVLLDLNGEDLIYDISEIADNCFYEGIFWYEKMGEDKKYYFTDLEKMADAEV